MEQELKEQLQRRLEIQDEKGDIITTTTEIQKIMRGYAGKQHDSKLENQEEMDEFLDS